MQQVGRGSGASFRKGCWGWRSIGIELLKEFASIGDCESRSVTSRTGNPVPIIFDWSLAGGAASRHVGMLLVQSIPNWQKFVDEFSYIKWCSRICRLWHGSGIYVTLFDVEHVVIPVMFLLETFL